MIRSEDVGLEVVHHEGIGAGSFCHEVVSTTVGVVHWRVPGKEEFPQPRPNEVVSFLTFHERGLGYPTHWFLRGLLNEWGLELQHLNPTGVLHIAGFVTVCEAFLGMESHADLFRLFFFRRAMTAGNSTETTLVGGGFTL